MKVDHIKILICPKCHDKLHLKILKSEENNTIQEGLLICDHCKTQYPIINSIPRFVSLDNYSSSFGYQWNIHSRTQYDSYTGLKISEERFFKETGWDRNLNGEIILEAGCGSGRFTEQALKTGAFVVSFDYSNAVDANYKNNKCDNLLVVQADIYNMPFRDGFFDKTFCIGVLQHTPDVKKAFDSLVKKVRSNGILVIDVYKKVPLYKKWFYTKYFVRMVTKHIDHIKLYKFIEKSITFLWPIIKFVSKLPLGRQINWFFLIADYRGIYPLTEEELKNWAILDTFDMLSPKYDYPQNIETVKKWFVENKFKNIEVKYGYNGIEGKGIKM